jgi:hypothetical protein
MRKNGVKPRMSQPEGENVMGGNPMPTGQQWAMIIGGAVIGGAIGFGLLDGGMIGGAITGVGAALGAIPYSRALQEHKKRQGGG